MEYEVVDAEPRHDLYVVLVQRGITHEPTRGENAGTTLHHENVAVEWKQKGEEREDRTTFDRPADADPEDLTVIAFLQDRETLLIEGATQVHLGD